VVGWIDSLETPREVIFLKDNVPVASTWESPTVSSTFNGTPVKYKRVFTITAKDVSLTVRAKVYNHVITVKEEFMLEVAGTGFELLDASVISYAKGIGLVQFKNDFFVVAVDLKRFQVF
jgi:hypothetical protein